MEIYPATPAFGVILLICLLGGMDRLLLLVAAMLPFGMLAVVGLPSVGGLSLLAANVAAAALAGCGVLLLLTRLLRGRPTPVEPTTLALALYTGYAILSATVLVRLFAGDTMVFSLARNASGVKVSTLFSWEKVWLGPSSSNISQTFYIVLGFGFFVSASHVLARRGPRFGERCLAVAAVLNLILGLLDAIKLDGPLGFIRTANYSLANEATESGFARIIGGFSEAASFGAASTMLFGYFASAALNGAGWRAAALALGSGAFAAMSLSSTGLLSLIAVLVILAVRAAASIRPVTSRTTVLTWTAIAALVALGISAMLVFTEAPALIGSVFDNLVVQKSASSSGAERTAWALGGIEALVDTFGLGAGAGSLRSNGLIFAQLGSVGVIGTLAFLAFLWLAFAGRARGGDAAILSNVRTAVAATLVSLLLSATVPDPGLPLLFLAALAVAAKGSRAPVLHPWPEPRFA